MGLVLSLQAHMLRVFGNRGTIEPLRVPYIVGDSVIEVGFLRE